MRGLISNTRNRSVVLLAFLICANGLFWAMTWASAQHVALLLSAGWLAYGFGLRHAVDADHISAIDNTTRRLMERGKRPTGVGFYFSLGHSTVVILLCAALSLSTAYVEKHMPQWEKLGGIVGGSISTVFLFAIGIINLVVLWDLYRAYRQVRRGDVPGAVAHEPALGGLMGRFLAPLLALVQHSWQMYFIGFLFGLGFDTATEVGILALSAHSSHGGVSFWAIMLLPLLFTAGMCLIDTLNGILMLRAYGWAFVRPVRRLYYNMSITAFSVLVAFVVGGHELVQLFSDHLPTHSVAMWAANLNFDNVGYAIIGVLVVFWLSAALRERQRGVVG